MSNADASARILDAAIALGVARGVGALSLQQVATAGGVSKALVLYHFAGKDALLAAVAERLARRDVEALDAAARNADAVDAWRRVAGDSRGRGERALLASLLLEDALRAQSTGLHAARANAAQRLATAMLAVAGLRPRIGTALLGRVLLHQLDGVAVAASGRSEVAVEADLDAAALAMLGLGH